jgi:putative heme iron utilization protein
MPVKYFHKNNCRKEVILLFDIKARLEKLKLSQAWMILRLHDKGVTVYQSQFSRYINGIERTPKAQRVLSMCNEILNEQEQAAANTH